MSLLLKLLVSN